MASKQASAAATASILQADVLVVGGGLVGGALTCALAHGGLSVLTVDAADPAVGLTAEFDGRAFAIARGSQALLDGIGLWPGLAETASPILDVRVSDGDSLLFLHYDHRDLGGAPFGYMVESLAFRRALAAHLPRLANTRLLAPARLTGLTRDAAGVEATLADGRRIRAALAVGADGRNSWTRRQAGIQVTRWSYPQIGIVCTVDHEKPHGNVAHEHFLPAGPFAILPLTGNRASLVWTERADIGPAIMALDEAGFQAELEARFGDFLGALRVVGPRWSYPLGLQFAETAVAERLVLVGDAFHGMHPIAGQGLNMGLRDVAALAEVLVDARRLGQDIGTAPVLADYQRWRRFDNTVMLATTDLFNRLFSNNLPPLRLARDLGLALVDRLPPLKRALSRNAMGLAGRVPRLMRGEPL